MKRKFNIVEIDEWDHALVIDWGDDCVFKHRMPKEMIDYDLTEEDLIRIIEELRPVIPKPKSLDALKRLQLGQNDLKRDTEFQNLLDQIGG